MNEKLINIINKELNMFKLNDFVIKQSSELESFTILPNEYFVDYELKPYITYYSFIDKQIVFGNIKDNSITYLLFPLDKINIKFEKVSSFEWTDRYIFTFND